MTDTNQLLEKNTLMNGFLRNVEAIALLALMASACGGSKASSNTHDSGTSTGGSGGADAGATGGSGGASGGSDAGAHASMISVLNGNGASVMSWDIGANGNTAPSSLLSGANTTLSIHSNGIAVDASGNLYVVSQSAIAVFGTAPNGNVAPTRIIQGSNVLAADYGFTAGIAVDTAGDVFAATSGFSGEPPEIRVFAAGANGNAAPIRVISGSNTGLTVAAQALALHGTDLYASTQNVSPAVAVFDASANGNVAPKNTLTIASSDVILDSVIGQFAVDSAGNLYVPMAQLANPSSTNTKVLVYPPSATAPSVTLTGAATELTAATGVALDTAGNIFVANADPAGPSILVFAAGDTGSAAPVRNISGPSTTLGAGTGDHLELVVY